MPHAIGPSSPSLLFCVSLSVLPSPPFLAEATVTPRAFSQIRSHISLNAAVNNVCSCRLPSLSRPSKAVQCQWVRGTAERREEEEERGTSGRREPSHFPLPSRSPSLLSYSAQWPPCSSCPFLPHTHRSLSLSLPPYPSLSLSVRSPFIAPRAKALFSCV